MRVIVVAELVTIDALSSVPHMKRSDSVYSSVGNFLTLVKPDAKFKEDVKGKDTYILNPKNPVLPAAAEV